MIHMLILFFSIIRQISPEIVHCDGNNYWTTYGCTHVEKNPLIIDRISEKFDLSQLKNVKIIHAGLIVKKTDLEEVFLENVIEIINKDGPAIIFEKNSNLKRIKMPKLIKITANSEYSPILFESDNFARVAFKNIVSYNDLLTLEQQDTYHRTCPTEIGFIKITEVEDKSYTTFWILIGACAVAFIVDLIILYFCCCKDKFCKRRHR